MIDANPIEQSKRLIAECRAEAFVDPSVSDLERLITSLAFQANALADRALASVIVAHRLARARLSRFRELNEGVL